MNILVIGGNGRLGKRLVPALWAAGHSVDAPLRVDCDATDAQSLADNLSIFKPDLVICLAAYADVVGCDKFPGSARQGNVITTCAVGSVCHRGGVPWVWTSTDYVVAYGPTPAEPALDNCAPERLRANTAGIYSTTKAEGEAAAVGLGATVARLAFCCPEDAEKWTWVDGYNLASREWVDRTAARLALLAPLAAEGWNAGRIVHVGPVAGIDDGPLGPWRTREQLVRRRFGDAHPSLRHVVRSPAERAARGGGNGPGDTRFAACAPELALEPG